jgi:cytochrome c
MSLLGCSRRGSRIAFASVFAVLAGVSELHAAEVDAENAMSVARRNNCLRCHAVEKRKKAPSYQEIGKKFGAKPDGEATLTKHVTGKNKVKVESSDEDHDPIPTKDEKEIKNFVRWVMTR